MANLDGDVGTQPHPGGDDQIIAEVRAAREALFAAAGYDLDELCRQLLARQEAAGREAVTLPPRPPDAPPRPSRPAGADAPAA